MYATRGPIESGPIKNGPPLRSGPIKNGPLLGSGPIENGPLLLALLLAASVAWGAVTAPSAGKPPVAPVALQGSLFQGATTVLPLARVTLEASVSDPGQTSGAITFSWQASGGRIIGQAPPTANPNRVTWVAPAFQGQYQIIVTATKSNRQPWSQVGIVAVTGGAGPRAGQLSLSTEPARLPADGRSTSTVTATLGGRGAGGKTVRFFTTAGTIAPVTAVTDASGVARATLTAAAAPQTATVTVMVDRTVAQAPVQFVAVLGPYVPYVPYMPMPSGGIALQPQVSAIPADGASQVLIVALVYDAYGQPAPYVAVFFSTNNGLITNQAVTDLYGQAAAALRASYNPRPAVVTAWTGWLQAATVVNFRPIQVRVTADPSQVPADGQSTASISAIVADTGNLAVADGTPVSFSATAGSLPYAAQTAGGVATVALTAPKDPGRATVTAQALGASGYATVEFTATAAPQPQQGARVVVAASPTEIPADGRATASIVALVTRDGKAVAGQEVRFSTTGGAITASAVTDDNGTARATLTAGTAPAVALVAARCGDAVDTVKVAFTKPGG